MADISAEAEVTLYNSSATVNIIISPRLLHNWEKPKMNPVLLPYMMENSVNTMIVDLGMNKFILNFDGIIRDDDSTSAETRISKLYTLFNSTSNVFVKFGSSSTSVSADSGSIYQNNGGVTKGSILKVEIRESVGRTQTDSSTRQRNGTYGKSYEVTIQFLIGDMMMV